MCLRKVTTRYLKSVGFRSSNDRMLIPILRGLGFIDSSQMPTERWKQYRDKSRSKEVLGTAIEAAYPELFKTYPDAYNRSPDTIRNFFSSKSNVADSTLRLAVTTFRALAAEASFDGKVVIEEPGEREEDQIENPGGRDASGGRGKAGMPTLSVAVQVYIDKEMTAEQVDHVFASMAKHLYGKD